MAGRDRMRATASGDAGSGSGRLFALVSGLNRTGRGVAAGLGVGDGFGFGVGVGVVVALGDAVTTATVGGTPCVLVDSLPGKKLSAAAPSDTSAAIAITHKAQFGICVFASFWSLEPQAKQNAACSGTSVPHFWQNMAEPFYGVTSAMDS